MLGFGQLQAGICTRGASVVRSGLLTWTCMRGNIRTTTLPCSRLATDTYCPNTPQQRRGGGKNEYIPFISWEEIIAGRGQVRLVPLPDNCPIKRVRRSRVLLAPPLLASALAPHWMAATRAGTLNPNATADGSNAIPSEQKRRRKG